MCVCGTCLLFAFETFSPYSLYSALLNFIDINLGSFFKPILFLLDNFGKVFQKTFKRNKFSFCFFVTMCLWYIYLFQMKPFHLFNLIWSENCSFSSSCCCCYVLYILIFLPVFVFWSILDTSNTRKTKTNKTLTKSIWESIILLFCFVLFCFFVISKKQKQNTFICYP